VPLPTPTPAGGCDCQELAAARATVAAQATRIAELEGELGTMTPTPPASPTPSPLAPPAPGTEPGVPPAGELITPDPAECTVAPRTLDDLRAIAATPDQAATDALLAAVAIPGLDLPAGQPADAATVEAIEATYRQMTACFNAGNDLAAYALWTDDALRQIPVSPPPADAPTVLPEGDRSAFRVTQVRVLPDGRVVAVWEERSTVFSTTVVQALLLQDGRYLVDETLDTMLASDGSDALASNS
jgi:hypothetical protein